ELVLHGPVLTVEVLSGCFHSLLPQARKAHLDNRGGTVHSFATSPIRCFTGGGHAPGSGSEPPLEALVGHDHAPTRQLQKRELDKGFYWPGLGWTRGVVQWPKVKNSVAPPNHPPSCNVPGRSTANAVAGGGRDMRLQRLVFGMTALVALSLFLSGPILATG